MIRGRLKRLGLEVSRNEDVPFPDRQAKVITAGGLPAWGTTRGSATCNLRQER